MMIMIMIMIMMIMMTGIPGQSPNSLTRKRLKTSHRMTPGTARRRQRNRYDIDSKFELIYRSKIELNVFSSF